MILAGFPKQLRAAALAASRRVRLTPNLVLTSYVQYDTQSQNIGTNTRFRWTIKPGNDLFIVWNRGWQRQILSPHDVRIVPDSDVVAVKLRWTFRR